MMCQGGGHAVEHTDTVEERTDQTGILLQLFRTIELDANVAPIGPQSFADRTLQPSWVDSIMYDIEGRDHIVLLRQPLRDVAVFKTHVICYTCRLGIGYGSFN